MSETNIGQLIWSIADQLRGVYRPAQYGTATLPFVILRRMECVLDGSREQVAERAARTSNEAVLAAQLRRDFGLHLWNTSAHTLESLLGDPDNLASNLIEYTSAFSTNVSDIFERFGFATTVTKLAEKNRLFLIVQQFAEVDLHPDRVSNADMGEIFEHLIFKFSTASNETAGEHFTPRDAIRLLVDLVLAPDDDLLSTPGAVRSVYDPTAGTGGMLSVAEEAMLRMNPGAAIALAGQELNDESYAICKSDMIGKGQRVDAIQLGDTLAHDAHAGSTFDYCMANPPYGGDWKASADAVRAEHASGDGRFNAGLPRISDGQMLFLQHIAAKMRPAQAGKENTGGRAGIVLNGSPLFTGGAGSGESEIRRHLLESDLVDAIVALPTNMFYNTGIATYIWILDNNKPEHRRGSVQLIDASKRWSKLRKNLGSKNREIGADDRADIVRLYDEFAESDESKIVANADFGYWDITIERPLRLHLSADDAAIDAVFELKAVAKLDDETRGSLRVALESLRGTTTTSRNEFTGWLDEALRGQHLNLGKPLRRAIVAACSQRTEDGEAVTDARGAIEADPELRESEIVPFSDTIDAYVEREVLPHVPDAWVDHSRTKIGYEIPFTRLFYTYTPPRPLAEIDAELSALGAEIIALLSEVEG